MTTQQRLQRDLGHMQRWDAIKPFFSPMEHLYGVWEDISGLIHEIESDPDAAKWEALLTPEERAQQRYPGGYAYTHQVLLPFLLKTFDLGRLLQSEEASALWLGAEHLTARFAMFSTLMFNTSTEARRQRELLPQDDEDANQHAEELAARVFYETLEHLNRHEPLLRELELEYMYLAPELTQALPDLSGLHMEALEQLAVMIPAHRPEDLQYWLNWASHQPNLKSLYVAFKGEATLTRVEPPLKLRSLILETAPRVRSYVIQLVEQRWLEGITELSLREHQVDKQNPPPKNTPRVLETISTSLPPTLQQLEAITHTRSGCDLSALSALGAPKLTDLQLRGYIISQRQVETLFKSEAVSQLEQLTLNETTLSDEALATIANSAQLSALKALKLNNNLIGHAGAVALIKALKRGMLPKLEQFSMYFGLLTIDSLDTLQKQIGARLDRGAEDCFGELRSILQAAQPSDKAWEQLTTLLECWPDADHLEQVAIPYTLDLLKAWPAEPCVLPQNWMHQLRTGQHSPLLQLVKHLKWDHIQGSDKPDELAINISEHPDLDHLQHLTFSRPALSAATHDQLTQSPNFANVESLALNADWDDEEQSGLYALLGGEWPRLKAFKLGERQEVDLEQLRLTERPWLKQLESLSLGIEDTLDRDGLEALLGQEPLELRHLALMGAALELDELSFERLPQLQHLHLEALQVDEDFWRTFFASPQLAQLTHLTLSSMDIALEHINTLINRKDLSLTHLELPFVYLEPSIITKLLSASWATSLRSLNLESVDLEGRAQIFNKVKQAPMVLERLNLNGTNIGNTALKALAQCEWISSLKVLSLDENYWEGTAGLKALLTAPKLNNLETLSLEDSSLSKKDFTYIYNAQNLPQKLREQFNPASYRY